MDGSVTHFELPVADKPLMKGYNYMASRHVGEIRLNPLNDVTHIWAEVLSSFKDKTYTVKIVLDNKTALVITASCGCPAGVGGKCNHAAALLFFLLCHVMSEAAASVTEKPQKWHQPSRKSKKDTKPGKAGERIVRKHVFEQQLKRKLPLQDYEA